MKKLILATALIASGAVYADGPSIKPGLWETKVVRDAVDGNDVTAQIPPAQAKMQVCISPAMAANYMANMIDPKGECAPTSLKTTGSKTNFSFSCTKNGRATAGTGEIVSGGDTVSSHVNVKVSDNTVTHTVEADTQMNYLGSDCKGVKPVDQLSSKP